jgi:predicted nucleic-acid-binding protein
LIKAAIDTNILVRLISNDNAVLVSKARGIIKPYSAGEIFVGYAVIWETYCVLRTCYSQKDERILQSIDDIINVDQFFIENDTAVRTALARAKEGAPFYDTLIGEVAALRNVKTCTFDKALRNNRNFIVVD